MPEVVLYSPEHHSWMRYIHPKAVFCIHEHAQVCPLLKHLEHEVETSGLHAVGFLSYEASAAFDPAMPQRQATFPLAWFGLFDAPEPVALTEGLFPTLDWHSDMDASAHARALQQIRNALAQGETYQVNYTYRQRAAWHGDPWSAFCALARRQPSAHGAFIDTDAYTVCCASPEAFFWRAGRDLWSRPMKGTAPRGRWPEEDRLAAHGLAHSVKDRAENVMIVDMVRNDLGRVCLPGSVQVPELFSIERYPTLWQMTSLVHGRCAEPTAHVIAALFPPASITGAPKIKTMHIIHDLEISPRKLYTGTIGVMQPGRKARFNVAIRTVLVDKTTGQAEYGVGGGIVWDSEPAAEYRETRIKARLLGQERPSFALLETMRWDRTHGIHLYAQHMRRLQKSAAYFDFTLDIDALTRSLEDELTTIIGDAGVVRLRVHHSGTWVIDHRPLPPTAPCRIAIAPFPVNSDDVMLFHKTTLREVYEASRAACPEADDVLLWNERGEITETTIANVVVELDGHMVTPPLHCGLLPGTMRAHLLETEAIRKAVLRIEDLPRCTGVWLISAVRGWRQASVLE